MVFNYVVVVRHLWNVFIYQIIFMNKKVYKITYRYYIVLFKNRRQIKTIRKSAKISTIMPTWHELKTEKTPPFIKIYSGKRKTETNYELALIYPKTRWSGKTYTKDELGRNLEVVLKNPKQRIKYIIPYWMEELIYDYDTKKRIRYHIMMEYILSIDQISQIFTLNNKLFVQVEDNIRLFGNKNINDANRLFDIVREDLLKRKRGNFIFVKDISTQQRINLYNLLESKGYKRTELFRHYSY